MDTNDVKKLLNDLVNTITQIIEKNRYNDQILKRRNDEIKKSKTAYNKLLGDLKAIKSKNGDLKNALKDRDENIRILMEDIGKLNTWKLKILNLINE